MDFKKLCVNCMKEKPNADDVCPYCHFDRRRYSVARHHLPPMTPLNGKYILGRALGEGGFGITYVAMDLKLQVMVAIKEMFLKNINTRDENGQVLVPDKDRLIFEQNKSHFLKEAQTLAMFNESDNESVVHVKDHFEENGTAYIVMEYIDGITLKDYVKKHNKLSEAETLGIITSIGHALSKIHGFNVIHKDVGPDNIMMTSNGKVKLLDFGSATNMYNDSNEIISFKRGYAPPEQYNEKGLIGPWVDIYALAATMYFCLTGVKPVDSMERKGGKVLPPLSSYGVKVNSKIEAAIMKALSLNSSDRFATMEEFCSALHVKKSESRPAASKPGKKGGKHHWLLIGVVAILAVVVAFMFTGKSDSGEHDTGDIPASEPDSQIEVTVPEETAPHYEVGDTIPMVLGTYIFENYTNPELILGVDSGFGDDGANLILKDYLDSNVNRIMVTDLDEADGFYNLQASHTGSYLQAWGTQELGSNIVQLQQPVDSGTEKWVFVYCGEEDGKDVVILQNAAGSVLAPKDQNVQAGTPMVLADRNMDDNTQKWYIRWSEIDQNEAPVHVYHEGDLIESISGTYNVASALDGNTMFSVSRYEGLAEPELIVWENVWDSTQQFRFELGEESRYHIFPLNQLEGENKCLEYDEASGKVVLRDVSDNVNQLFRVVYTGYNMYLIQAYNENVLGFEMHEDGSINGGAMCVKPYADFTDSRLEKWILQEVVE